MADSASSSAAALRRRWLDRFPSLPDVGDRLVARYGGATRVYHDLRHLADVLAGVDTLRDECVDLDAVELAGWFHDAVYDLLRSDNEAASAALAGTLLSPYLPPQTVDEVRRLVMLTRDHRVTAGDANGAVLCDADLAILASDRERYDDYAARVRLEFAHVSDEAFRAGRSGVLLGLLALPSLFHTSRGSREWESPARDNLRRELTRLR